MMVLAIHCSRTPSTRCMDEAMCLLNPARRAPLSGGPHLRRTRSSGSSFQEKDSPYSIKWLNFPVCFTWNHPSILFLLLVEEYVPLPPAACLTYCSKLSNQHSCLVYLQLSQASCSEFILYRGVSLQKKMINLIEQSCRNPWIQYAQVEEVVTSEVKKIIIYIYRKF